MSTETGQPFFFAKATIGFSRAISISGETDFERGLLEAAPMSSAFAPSAMSEPACSRAALGSRKRPASENELSVMLRMPKMKVSLTGEGSAEGAGPRRA